MNGRFFIDTSVLVYANAADVPVKRTVARGILEDALSSGMGCLSTQILQEFFVAVTRKLGVDADHARRQLEILGGLPTVVVDRELVLGAVDLHRLHRISFWDALVVRSAAVARCATLLTEDLAHGAVIDGVRVMDPFRD